MYILFINSSDRCNKFFFTQFNNNSNKKNYQTHGFNPTQPDTYGLGWTHMDWVGLNLCDGLSWVEFFFNPPWWVRSKNPLNPTQLDPCTPLIMNIYVTT